jgi:hypothetical protein
VQKFRNIILRAVTNVNNNGIVVLLHSMKANKGGGCKAPLILNLGVIWWWSGSHPGRLIPGEEPAVLTEQEGGWAPEPVWTN